MKPNYCPICLSDDEEDDFIITLCLHKICKNCFLQILRKNPFCPMCRK